VCERGSHITLFINDQHGGRFWNIDRCVARLVQMLLELKVGVIQACCGHGEQLAHAVLIKRDVRPPLDLCYRPF